jgi:hypothetical protein
MISCESKWLNVHANLHMGDKYAFGTHLSPEIKDFMTDN